jgi:hypothetical protein
MANAHIDMLRACIDSVAAKISSAEAIAGIRQGVPLYSKNTQVPFMVDVATLDGTGQVSGAKRGIVALVTSNTPHQVTLTENQLPSISWQPL